MVIKGFCQDQSTNEVIKHLHTMCKKGSFTSSTYFSCILQDFWDRPSSSIFSCRARYLFTICPEYYANNNKNNIANKNNKNNNKAVACSNSFIIMCLQVPFFDILLTLLPI